MTYTEKKTNSMDNELRNIKSELCDLTFFVTGAWAAAEDKTAKHVYQHISEKLKELYERHIKLQVEY